MKYILITLVIVMLLSTPVSGGLDRDASLEAEGRVNIQSYSSNETAETASRVTGDGKVNYVTGTALDSNELDQAFAIELRSCPESLRSLEAIVSARLDNNIYAILIAPDRCNEASLNVRYQASGEETLALTSLKVDAQAEVMQGEFRTFIDIFDPTRNLTLRERVLVWGFVRFVDKLSLSIPFEEGDE